MFGYASPGISANAAAKADAVPGRRRCRRAGCGGPVGIAALHDTDLLEQAAAEGGDLERCVAWAWLLHTAQ